MDTQEELSGRNKPMLLRDNSGRFVQGTGKPYQFTAENASENQRKGVIAKRAAALDAANRAVQDVSMIERYGNMAWIADVVTSQMQVATQPDAPNSTRAADFIARATGLHETARSDDDIADTVRVVHTVDADVLALLASVIDDWRIDASVPAQFSDITQHTHTDNEEERGG